MSDTKVKISELPAVSEVLGTDESPSVQSSTTKKFSMTQLGTYILNSFSGLSLGGIAQTAKSAIDTVTTALTTLTNFVGSTSMGTTATTVTGAIAEHEGDITSINSSLSVSTYTITSVDATVFALNRYNAVRQGNRVTVAFDVTAQREVTSATQVNLVKLPSAITPSTETPPRVSIVQVGSTGMMYTTLARFVISGGVGYINQNAVATVPSGGKLSVYIEYYL